MELCVLSSGSCGNCIYVSAGDTELLVDDGISYCLLKSSLAEIGRSPDRVAAVLFTHEHSDHCSGLRPFCRKHPETALYATEGTASGVELSVNSGKCKPCDMMWTVFESGCQPFEIGDLQITPFQIPHDASDPVGYVISDGVHRVAVATDIGIATELIRRRLSGCDAIVLEANHDVEMLRASSRPQSTIQRILGRHGHLSNEQSAELLAEVASPSLKAVFPAHISGECNTLDLAEAAMRSALKSVGLEKTTRIIPTHHLAVSEKLVL